MHTSFSLKVADMDVSPETKLTQQSTLGYKSLDPTLPPDLSRLPLEIQLKQLDSDGPDLGDLKGENGDSPCGQRLPVFAFAAMVTFAVGVTAALILQIHLGKTLVFTEAKLVSDDERCTTLGLGVLSAGGSSVDAAVAAALCLGVVHPHVSGIGGGGVMLVHDIRINETTLIDFQGAAPRAVTKEMLRSGSETEDVVAGVAAVARDGFNVSLGLADAISEVKGERLPQRFRAAFFPGGRALQAGSLLKMPGLAEVLEADPLSFYSGNLSREMEDEVRANGGVLSREDLRSYRAEIRRPTEGLYKELIVKVPPSPPTDAALLSALKLLNSISEKNNTENHTHHWTTEVLRAALADSLDNPKLNISITNELPDLLSNYWSSPPEEWRTSASPQAGSAAAQVVVMGADDLIVTAASSLGRLFGSRVMTSSGVILNSLILKTSGPKQVEGRHVGERNDVNLVSRPLSALMPTIVVPAWKTCGIYVALSDSGRHSLSAILQVLMSAHSYITKRNNSFHLPLQSGFADGSVQFSHTPAGHTVPRAKAGRVVRGILRIKDYINGITVPESLY